jgi:5-methylcytosine-specific restriction endonuclease McrA
MELVYTFDPERFYLGTLCKRGHKWPGTEQSLRRTFIDKRGKNCSQCVGCTGAETKDWLLSFVDSAAMGLGDAERLGPICKGGHLWHGHQLTLRLKGKCPECERIRKRTLTPEQREKERLRQRQWYQRTAYDHKAQKAKREAIKARMAADPEFAEYIWQQRRRLKEQARRRAGMKQLPPLEIRQLQNAIRKSGCLPSVARLVAIEQRRYWREHPEVADLAMRQREREDRLFRYKIDPVYRLIEREKSSRRRAARFFAGISYKVPAVQIHQRFHRFGHRCAYCGIAGDMQIEHVRPISKGGLHHINNIVPACLPCNYSKKTQPMEQWYRSQPFFDPARLALIQSLTGPPEAEQLSLGLAS